MKKLGFGTMRLPIADNDDPTSVIQDEVDMMVDTFMENGFTYFDTAYSYHNGTSEVALNKALIERYPRESYIIADKLPIFMITKQEELEPIFEEQFKRLGVDYIDYYLMHNVSGLSEAGFIDVNSFEFAKKKKEEGYIKKLGISSHANAEYLDNILNQHPDMDFIQLQINYLDWENDVVEARKCYEVARKHDLEIVVIEPLKGGFLANVPKKAEKLMRDYNGQSPLEWALRFVAGLPGVFMVLSGMSSQKQVAENVKIFDNIKPLNDEEHEILKEVVKIINENIAVECTGCNYCINSCPENIAIPKVFDMYNLEMIDNKKRFTAVVNAYVNYAKEAKHGLASDCIKCGACISQCPQHINIPEELEKVKDTFETPFESFYK